MNTNQVETTEQSKIFNDNNTPLVNPIPSKNSAFKAFSSCNICSINFNTINDSKNILKESEENLYKANEIIKKKDKNLADFKLELQFLTEECNILRKRNVQLFQNNQLYKQKENRKKYEKEITEELATKRQKILSINDPLVSDDVLIN